MKTKKDTMIKILNEINEYLIKKNIINSEIYSMIEQVYKNTILSFKKSYDVKGKTTQEIEEYAELVITLADQNIITIISAYSLDCSPSPYILPTSRIDKLRKFYGRILIRDKKKSNLDELFLNLFQISYAPSIRSAIAHRKQVISEKNKNKKKNKKNKK